MLLLGQEYDSWKIKAENGEKYYIEKIKKLNSIFGSIDKLKKVILSKSYTKLDLVNDLKEIKEAMKIFKHK